MRASRRPWGLCLALITAIGLAVAGCDGAQPPEPDATAAATPFPVAIHIANVPTDLTVGVVVSLTSPVGEGSQWKDAAQGAALAAWRLRQAGISVTVKTVDDKGTDAGAQAAVSALAADRVSAILVATSGSHVDAELAAASGAGILAVAPYAYQQKDLPAGAWVTGPSASAVQTSTQAALAHLGATRPVGIVVGNAPLPVQTVQTIAVDPSASAASLAETVTLRAKGLGGDAFVVSGDATQAATVATALQGAGLTQPVVFSPDALSPAFAAGLAAQAGSASGNYWTVGPSDDDSAALAPSLDGQAVSAFLAADRQAAQDSSAMNLTGDEPFSSVAAFADVSSHDAFLAVVAAAASARSVAPADVAAAMGTLTVNHADGLAGPELTFTSPYALADSAVTYLHASPQVTGLRPSAAASAPSLDWFPVATS